MTRATTPNCAMDSVPIWLHSKEVRRASPRKLGAGSRSPGFGPEFLRMLGDEIQAFAEWVPPTPRELEEREAFVERVRDIVVKLWPTSTVQV